MGDTLTPIYAMDSRGTPPFVKRLPYVSDKASVACPIEIRPMTLGDAFYWHSAVQPLINDQYIKLSTRGYRRGDPMAGLRADVGWNWPLVYSLAATFNWGRPPAERARAWLVAAKVVEGLVPIGMLTEVAVYASPYQDDETKKLGFVWYLSNAPMEHYRKVGLSPLRNVGYVLLDVAIQSRLQSSGDGAIFLHADPAGGDKLSTFYGEKCGMTRLWSEKRLSPFRKMIPGEYFAFTHEEALSFAKRLDPLRT